MPIKCPHCGLFSPDTAQRCDCGYDFSKATAEDMKVNRAAAAQDIKSGHWSIRQHLGYVALVLGVMLLFWGDSFGRGAHPNVPAPAQGYVVEVSDDDYSGSYYITPEEWRARVERTAGGIALVALGWVLLKLSRRSRPTR